MSKDACEMIRSYLTNRKQRVKIDDVCSDWKYTVRGVPQGSQAGPHIFNIFLCDFFYALEDLCDPIKFADDNSLSKVDYDIGKIKEDLEQSCKVAIQWFQRQFHESKCI